MRINYKGHAIDTKVVTGQLTKASIKSLDVFFSYDEPIAICYPQKAIINAEPACSSTTSRHINHVKKLYTEREEFLYIDFHIKMEQLLNGEWGES